jgi:hypothetical protein
MLPEYIDAQNADIAGFDGSTSLFETFAVGEPVRQAIGQGCRRRVPAGQTGTPMTHMLDSKQCIVVAIGGHNYPSQSVAFRLFN